MNIRTRLLLVGLAWSIANVCCTSRAADPERDGPWLQQTTADGKWIHTAEMSLTAQAEPKPALKHRLVPEPFATAEGNSAIYYLKAMAFLEQAANQEALLQFYRKYRKLAQEQGTGVNGLPPYSWHSMAPQQLPLQEVKEFLRYSSFQVPLLSEAARRSDFKLDRHIREVDSPVAYLLPEMQTMRDLARTQSLRCRVAIAEHRLTDAIEILAQQFTMAHHIGLDEFLVSNLVGVSVLSIALEDMVYLLQEPNVPNLYWALACLPSPMIDMRQALSTERHFLSMQVKALQEVDETPRPAGYWQDFVDRVQPRLRELELVSVGSWAQDPQLERAALVAVIAAAYPGAKRFLIEECQMDQAKVDAYPTAQVVFLAMKRFNEQLVDEQYKWVGLSYDQILNHPAYQQLSNAQAERSQRLGWASLPCDMLLSNTSGIFAAQTRAQQQIKLLQTIEAIRMYAKANGNKLPPALSDLPYPAPNDPFTGKAFQYELSGDTAMLTGQFTPNIQYRFKLHIAK